MFDESLDVCEQAQKVSIRYNNLRYIPNILYNIANGKNAKGEEEHVVKTYVLRAYHCVCAIEAFKVAEMIKTDAKESLSTILC